MWQLSKEVVAELKEVFMLFDKDEDQKTYKMRKNTSLTVKTYNGISLLDPAQYWLMSNKFQTNFKLFLCQSKVDRHTQSHFEVDHTDGVLSFPELEVVMKNLGQVPTETELLRMVREVRKVPVWEIGSQSNFLFPR